MLPAALRARYAEEFSDELLELPHGEQLGYALRLLSRSWPLRHVLNSSLRDSRVPRPRRKPVLVPFVAAAVLMIAFSGVGLGARAAEPGDRLWSLTKVLYTEHGRSVEGEAEARVQLEQASAALAQGRVGETQIALAWTQDGLRAVNDVDSRAELEQASEALAEARVDDAQIALAQVEDQLQVVDDKESRAELEKEAEELRDELG